MTLKISLNFFVPWLMIILIIGFGIRSINAQAHSCSFNVNNLSFKGTSLEQANCLLRKVKVKGHVEDQALPTVLSKIIDQSVKVTKESLRQYLKTKGIKENEIGGSLDNQISRGRNNDKTAPFASYFVIHDTSSPNLCKVTDFPNDIDNSSWIWKGIRWNNPNITLYTNSGEAHLYITRDGSSTAPQNRTFATAWRATKLESSDSRTKGMFLHIENVQPRHCNPALIESGKCIRIIKNKKTSVLNNLCK